MRTHFTAATALVLVMASGQAARAAGVPQDGSEPAQPGPLAVEPVPMVVEPLAEIDARQTARRAVKIGTGVALGMTATLGLILALNKGTLFNQGLCNTPGATPIFGSYGCNELGLVHGLGAMTSILGYTAGSVLDATTPRREPKLPGLYYAAKYVSLGGFILAPTLGILSRFPSVVGLRQSEGLQRGLRTAHIGTALLTATAYTVSVVLDF